MKNVTLPLVSDFCFCKPLKRVEKCMNGVCVSLRDLYLLLDCSVFEEKMPEMLTLLLAFSMFHVLNQIWVAIILPPKFFE